MPPKISVLVPVYKVEPYLQRCIDSVLAQDFQDWEMILVDDGSPDRCPEICDEAAEKDERITVVHKENGGLPSARLAGFERAKGDYLVFLDSDDWLLEGALTTLYEAITCDGGYDIVKARPLRVDSVGNRSQESYRINEGIITGNESYGKAIILEDIHPYLHSSIYRNTVFEVNIFKSVSDCNISFCEDWFANVLAIKNVNRVRLISQSTYAYYVNQDSIVGTCIISPRMNVLIEQLLGPPCREISASLYDALECKKQINNIRSFFHPEIKFSQERYEEVKKYCLTELLDIKEHIDLKFLKWIQYSAIYRLYVEIYRLLFLLYKLKCNKRRVLYENC